MAEKEKKEFDEFKVFIQSGVVFGLLMYAFYYLLYGYASVTESAVSGIIFGLIMMLYTRYKHTKENAKP